MGLLDGLLAQVNENADIKNLAAKVGLTPEQVESAVTALAQAHPAPGDTVATAAASTGLPADILQQVVAHIGGEGSLGQFAGLLNGPMGQAVLGQVEGQAGQAVLGQLEGMATSFFAKK